MVKNLNISFLCGKSRLVLQDFSTYQDDGSAASEDDVAHERAFDVNNDTQLWMDPLLVQYRQEMRSRVAWQATVMRYLIQKMGVRHVSLAMRLSAAINRLKQHSIEWNNTDMMQFVSEYVELDGKNGCRRFSRR